eukprot:g3235.t1
MGEGRTTGELYSYAIANQEQRYSYGRGYAGGRDGNGHGGNWYGGEGGGKSKGRNNPHGGAGGNNCNNSHGGGGHDWGNKSPGRVSGSRVDRSYQRKKVGESIASICGDRLTRLGDGYTPEGGGWHHGGALRAAMLTEKLPSKDYRFPDV